MAAINAPAEAAILSKIRACGHEGDYAKARKIMRRHAGKLPKWRMEQEWAEGYREVIAASLAGTAREIRKLDWPDIERLQAVIDERLAA